MHKFIETGCNLTNDRGNALFLILIAVALFAALSYAITNSSRGGGGIDKEQEMLDQAVSQQCTASIEHGINKLKILNGCPDDQISYELADGTNENVNNTSDTNCFLFDNNGAGITACGAYLDPLVTTGTILADDTTTIALMASGVYFYCPTWESGIKRCEFNLSLDGTSFFAPTGNVCLFKGDGSDSARDSGGGYTGDFADAVGDAMCLAACGGGATGMVYGAGAPSPQYYIENDFSLSSYTGTCSQGGVAEVVCDCF